MPNFGKNKTNPNYPFKMENKRLKVGIFSPYIDMYGGGERYVLSIAGSLSQKHDVFLYADKITQKHSREKLDIFLGRVHFLPENLLRKQNLLNRYRYLCEFDLFLYMTDGSVFLSGARSNFLIVQSPLHIPKMNSLNRIKMHNWKIICYSQFMKDIISKRLGNSYSVYPLAPCVKIPNEPGNESGKKNIILTVGRFFPYPHDKKHDILIDVFLNSYKKYFPGWKLVIAGGLTEKGGKEVLDRLKKKAQGYPIEILVNISAVKLKELYREAKIYWHATGFGEDLSKFPEKAEHFGISPLEAMSFGCVPLLFNAGGLKDIISGYSGGFLWETEEELTDKTNRLINDKKLFDDKSQTAKLNAQKYSCDKFYAKIEKIISG